MSFLTILVCRANILEVMDDSNKGDCAEAIYASDKRENNFDDETDSDRSHSELEKRPVRCITRAFGFCEENVTEYWMAFNI